MGYLTAGFVFWVVWAVLKFVGNRLLGVWNARVNSWMNSIIDRLGIPTAIAVGAQRTAEGYFLIPLSAIGGLGFAAYLETSAIETALLMIGGAVAMTVLMGVLGYIGSQVGSTSVPSEPRLRLKPCAAERALTGLKLVGSDFEEALVGHAWFAYADVWNEPTARKPEARAQRVIARLGFFAADRRTRLIPDDIGGRWADTDQPMLRPVWASRNDLLPMDFDVNGLAHPLDLVVCLPDGTLFATNNEHLPIERYAPYQIDVDRFSIRVQLTGEGIEIEWWIDVSIIEPQGMNDSPFVLSVG